MEADIENVDRTFGTTISHHVTSSQPDGLPDNSIHLKLKGKKVVALNEIIFQSQWSETKGGMENVQMKTLKSTL